MSRLRIVTPQVFRISKTRPIAASGRDASTGAIAAFVMVMLIAGCVRRVPAGRDAGGDAGGGFDATTVERGDVVFLVERFFFPPGATMIPADAEPAIARVAARLNERRYRRRAVLVEGHSDASGPDAVNERLSAARAESIAELLVEHGVDAGRIHSRGFGAMRPLAAEQRASGLGSLEARARNRRVDIVLGDPPNQ